MRRDAAAFLRGGWLVRGFFADDGRGSARFARSSRSDVGGVNMDRTVSIPQGDIELEGSLEIPSSARGVVVFAHGSGSSRFSSRNRHVASVIRDGRLGTLLIDLLTASEA